MKILAENEEACQPETEESCQLERGAAAEGIASPLRGSTFIYRPRKVTPAFRALLLDTFSINPNTQFGQFALRLLDYLLFPSMTEEDTSRIILPCQTVAALVGVPYNRRFVARDWLQKFDMLIPHMRIREARYIEGKARTVNVFWPMNIFRARQHELSLIGSSHIPRVYLDTGKAVTVRSRGLERQAFADLSENRKAALPLEDHPSYELAKLLHSQSQQAIRKLFNRNLDALIFAAHAMPEETGREQNKKLCALSRIGDLIEYSGMFYKTSEKTVRLSAIDITIHQLPRELRKIALQGCYSIDLKSAQLALAARYWNIPLLSEFLVSADKSGSSFWTEMLTSLSLSPASKPALKTATYALVFGRTRNRLVGCLAADLAMADSQGYSAAKQFMSHPLIQALLVARDKKIEETRRAGGLRDAFGTWRPAHTAQEVRSAMAQQLQSYELRLMRSVVPILRSEARLHVVSWLHDGLSVYCSDASQANRQIGRIEKAINREAKSLGVITRVETEGPDSIGGPQNITGN